MVTVIIVNWNKLHLLKQCLQTLAVQTYQDFEIFLVDNGSNEEGTQEFFRQIQSSKSKYQIKSRVQNPRFHVIRLKENVGFARGNNVAVNEILKNYRLRIADYDYVLCLNNDTELTPDFLERLVSGLEKTQKERGSRFQAAQGLVVRRNVNDSPCIVPLPLRERPCPIWPTPVGTGGQGEGERSVKFPSHKRRENNLIIDSTGIQITFDGSARARMADFALQATMTKQGKNAASYSTSCEIFGPSASASLYSIDLVQDVVEKDGYFFDEDFHSYLEDVDLSYRMRWYGYKTWYVSDAIVYHQHSATGGAGSPLKGKMINRNRLYVITKNFPFFRFIVALLFSPARYFLHFLALVQKKGSSHRLHQKVSSKFEIIRIVLEGWWEYLRNFGKMWRKRKNIFSRKVVDKKEFEKWLKEYRVSVSDTAFS